LFALLSSAAPQDVDRDAYARSYVQFQVQQLDQWSTEFPQQFYANLMKPPVDSSKLSETAKASAGEFGDAIKRLAALTSAKDLMSNAEFRTHLDKALASSKELNQAMSTQRFPAPLQSSWDQMRSILNNLARVYKLDALAVLDRPGGGGRGGRGGRGAAAATTAATATRTINRRPKPRSFATAGGGWIPSPGGLTPFAPRSNELNWLDARR